MTDNTISIPCAHCNGSGQRQLAGEPASTLKALKKLGRASCVKVHRAMIKSGEIEPATSVTITYKRMNRLFKRGLVRKLDQRGPVSKGERGWAGFFEVV